VRGGRGRGGGCSKVVSGLQEEIGALFKREEQALWGGKEGTFSQRPLEMGVSACVPSEYNVCRGLW
jgi:hypothetical protein